MNLKDITRLREFLIRMEISQKELAAELGYTEQYISGIALGKRPMTDAFIQRLLQIYGGKVRESWLYGEDEYMTDELKEHGIYLAERKRKNLLKQCNEAADTLIDAVAGKDGLNPIYDAVLKRELFDFIAFKLKQLEGNKEHG